MRQKHAQRPQLLVLNDPHAMRINRDLAIEIGLNESIVLLQLEYLIRLGGHERDGRLWTYQSLTDLHDVYFGWWSVATIARIVKNLETMNLIVIGNFNKLGYDRTQWYALNEDGIGKLHSVAISQNEKWISQRETPISQNEKSISQIDQIHFSICEDRSDQNETTIPEITHEIHERDHVGGADAPTPATPPTVKDPHQLHPACLLYRDLTGYRPNKVGAGLIAAAVGTAPEQLEQWRTVVEAWIGRGNRYSNVSGMLDWFQQGVPNDRSFSSRRPSARSDRNPDPSTLGPLGRKADLDRDL